MSYKESIKNIQESLKNVMDIFDEVKGCISEEDVEYFKLNSNEAIALGDRLLGNSEPTIKEFVSEYI